jgi:hypothetical protein
MPSPEEKQRIDYRSKARAHVQAAREMLKSDDAFAPAYACLHARFAIETLAYDRLQDYLFEVSLTAMNGWTPKAVLKELLYTDPDACSPVSVTFNWKSGQSALRGRNPMSCYSVAEEIMPGHADFLVADAVPRNRSPLASATVSTLFFPVSNIFSAKMRARGRFCVVALGLLPAFPGKSERQVKKVGASTTL